MAEKPVFTRQNAFLDVAYKNRTRGKHFADISFHSHDDYEIYYFHNGKCHYFIHDKIYDLSRFSKLKDRGIRWGPPD